MAVAAFTDYKNKGVCKIICDFAKSILSSSGCDVGTVWRKTPLLEHDRIVFEYRELLTYSVH